MMQITDGTLSSATDRSLVSVLSNLLLAAFDGPPPDRDATVGGAGQRVPRRRSVVVRPPVVRPSWGIALGIASSATVLVLAMGLLSVLGAVALVMLG